MLLVFYTKGGVLKKHVIFFLNVKVCFAHVRAAVIYYNHNQVQPGWFHLQEKFTFLRSMADKHLPRAVRDLLLGRMEELKENDVFKHRYQKQAASMVAAELKYTYSVRLLEKAAYNMARQQRRQLENDDPHFDVPQRAAVPRGLLPLPYPGAGAGPLPYPGARGAGPLPYPGAPYGPLEADIHHVCDCTSLCYDKFIFYFRLLILLS